MVEFLEGIWPWLLANYISFIIFYLTGGVVYAISKWIFTLYQLRSSVLSIDDTVIQTERSNWLRKYDGVDDEEVVRALRKRYAGSYFNDSSYPPLASRNKSLFVVWALFWPLNLIWTMIADVTVEFFSWIHTKWTGFLQYLSNKISVQ